MMQKTLFRTSYSMLNAWHNKNYEDAINMYLGVEIPPTPAMQAGKDFHQQWQTEGETTGCLPKIFGARKLLNPTFEQKIVKVLDDWIELVGVLDVKEDGVGIDYKSGHANASYYVRSYQHKVYQILVPSLTKFEYHCYNQYTKTVDVGICHLSKLTLEQGLEFVITNASDMRAYLEQNNLIKERVSS